MIERRALILVAALVVTGMFAASPLAAQPASTGACTAIYDPVCARKKDQLIEFPNACLAGLERARVLAKGRCPQGCPMIYRPVCAEDKQGVRRNYGNACAAEKDGAKIVRNRRCFLTFGRR
ncbi:MAG TPA: Kazal-type serine protease inhibitor domain-containing protein [Pseudorhodoplanes sp.]|nr:Kazal-type serine protease inhibitor domain-containing protein [Pseudorhodoplanes sp.]